MKLCALTPSPRFQQQGDFKCDICSKVFCSINALHLHLKTVHYFLRPSDKSKIEIVNLEFYICLVDIEIKCSEPTEL